MEKFHRNLAQGWILPRSPARPEEVASPVNRKGPALLKAFLEVGSNQGGVLIRRGGRENSPISIFLISVWFQYQHRQGRQLQIQRVLPPDPGDSVGGDFTQVPDIGTAIDCRIGVQYFAVAPRQRHRNPVIFTHHGREVCYYNEIILRVSRPAYEREDARIAVIAIHPFKSWRLEIHLVEGRFGAKQRIQILDKFLDKIG